MIHRLSGDATLSERQTICCTVNTVGVMGKGIALTVKQRFPNVFASYRDLCTSKALDIKTLWTVSIADSEQQVLLFPTKIHWRNPSQKEWVEFNLKRLALDYELLGITSLAMVRPGGSNGKLPIDWIDEKVEQYLGDLPFDIDYYVD